MRGAAVPLLVALAIVGGISPAQAANDPAAPPGGCSVTARAVRSECLDRPSSAASALRLALESDRWIVSETTSPVDYSPIATATTSSLNGSGAAALHLSIRCRGGRTELTVAGAGIFGRSDDYVISYRVNGGQVMQLAGTAPAFGEGVAFKGDVVALLRSLPGQGELAVRIFHLSGKTIEGTFSLDGIEALRTRIGPTCKWPHAIAKPNDR